MCSFPFSGVGEVMSLTCPSSGRRHKKDAFCLRGEATQVGQACLPAGSRYLWLLGLTLPTFIFLFIKRRSNFVFYVVFFLKNVSLKVSDGTSSCWIRSMFIGCPLMRLSVFVYSLFVLVCIIFCASTWAQLHISWKYIKDLKTIWEKHL